MAEFLNAYHFVPLSDGASRVGDDLSMDVETARDRQFGYSLAVRDGHAVYDGKAVSGRIVCKITTQSPLVVGGRLRKGAERPATYNILEPFMLDGAPAIPATSLKGMISSIAEAVSGSSMRVLAKHQLSYRKPMGRALHALGRLVRNGEEWLLEPLTAPAMEKARNGDYYDFPKPIWRKVYERNDRSYINFKTYLGTYSDRSSAEYFRNQILPGSSGVSGSAEDEFFFMDGCWGGPLDEILRRLGETTYFKHKGPLVIAFNTETWRTVKETASKSEKQWLEKALTTRDYATLSDDDKKNYVRGFVRVLGVQGRDVPNNKKHELFIPFPEGMEETIAALRVPVSAKATARFRALAELVAAGNEEGAEDEAAERAWQPYLPFGAATASPPDASRRRSATDAPELREGDIVYFDVEPDAKGEPVVSEISFSAIWRDAPVAQDGARLADAHDFVGRIDPELLPMSAKRKRITPAERIFGYVPVSEGPSQGIDDPLRAVAGRVRFSNALPGPAGAAFLGGTPDFADERLEEAPGGADGFVRLKELSSPKLPSPSLYFRTSDGKQRIGKTNFTLEQALPQGRKFYLHQIAGAQGEPWRTRISSQEDVQERSAQRKTAVKPVAAGQEFWFHVDFDNLSTRELQLLCYALRPSQKFWHKLGHGKSIGLGSVSIDPVATLVVDRRARYGEQSPFESRRYVLHGSLGGAPARYDANACDKGDDTLAPLTLRALYRPPSPKAAAALLKIGEHRPDDRLPVLSVPLDTDRFAKRVAGLAESETFKWFVNNERPEQEPPQHLRPLDTVEDIANTALRTNRPKPKNSGGPRGGGPKGRGR